MHDLSVFPATYAEARARFIDACGRRGGRVHSLAQRGESGPSGEPLFLDVGVFGNPKAPKVLVVGSGTHGVEGYAGSAAQVGWILRGGPEALPADVAVVFTHAHNPWGFAHGWRENEENVDLNRNFVPHDAGHPANPGYARLHPQITPDEWNEAGVTRVFDALEAFREQHGEQAFSDAYNGGQYSHADGIFFGGQREQWSHAALREAIGTHVGHARMAAMIDLHTGIGPALDHIFLGFHSPGSAAHERARAWWGDRAVNRAGVTHKAVAHYKGLLVDAFCDWLPGVETTATVVEFGTLPRPAMQRAVLSGRWLRFRGDAHPEQARTIKGEYIDAFYPAAREWRLAASEQSKDIIDRAVSGLARG